MSKTFGVFIVVNGAWKLHHAYDNKSQAVAEKSYLVDMLGLRAEVFVKTA